MDIENEEQYLQVGAKLHLAPDDIRQEGMRAMFRFEQLNPGVRERAKARLSDLETNPLYKEPEYVEAKEKEEADYQANLRRTEGLKYVPQKQRALAEKALNAPALDVPGLVYGPEAEEAIKARQALAGETDDQSNRLRSLSGRPDLYAPPENVGELPDTLRGWVSRALRSNVWREPPVEVARQALIEQGMDPEQAKGITEGSDAYREFADQAWREAYEQAKLEGRPLKRYSQENLDTLGGKLVRAKEDLADTYQAFRGGARSAVIPGSDQIIDSAEGALEGLATGEGAREGSIAARAELQGAKARHPVATTLGGLAGSLLPSPVGKVARAGSGLIAKSGAGLGRRLAGGALGGALSGAASFSAERAVERGLDKVQGLSDGRTLKDDAKGLATSAALGAGFGLGGQALAEGGFAYRRYLRNDRGADSDALNKAERAGYKTSIRSGLKPGPLAQERIDAARAEGYTPLDVAAREARPHLEEGARKLDSELKGLHEGEWNRYLSTPEGREPVSTDPLVDNMLDELGNRKLPGGTDLPFTDTSFKEHARPLIEAEPVFAENAPKDARVMTVKELEDRGFSRKEIADMVPEETLKRLGIKREQLLTAPPKTEIPVQPERVVGADETGIERAAGETLASHPNAPEVDALLNRERAYVGKLQRGEPVPPERVAEVGKVAEGAQRALQDTAAAGKGYAGSNYHGVNIPPDKLDEIVSSGSYTTDRITSSSFDREGAESFAKKGSGVPVIFEMRHSPAVPVDEFPGSNTYRELLTPQGTKLRVTGVREENGVTVVTVEDSYKRARTLPPGGDPGMMAARERLMEAEKKLDALPKFPTTEEEEALVAEAAAEVQDAKEAYLNAQKGLGPMKLRGGSAQPEKDYSLQPDTRIAIRGRKLTADQIDRVTSGIDEAAKIDRTQRGTSDPAYKRFSEGIREARDQLRPNDAAPDTLVEEVETSQGPTKVTGPSAMKARQHRERSDVENTFQHAGLPGQLPKNRSRPVGPDGKPQGRPELALNANQEKAFHQAIAAYETTAPGSIHRDKALRELAAWADKDGSLRKAKEALDLVSGVRYGEEVRRGHQQKEVPGSRAGIIRGIAKFASLRLDPVADAVSFQPATGNLRQILNVMRQMPVQQTFGTAGGELGRKASSSAQGLDDEDMKNLKVLLEASGELPKQKGKEKTK